MIKLITKRALPILCICIALATGCTKNTTGEPSGSGGTPLVTEGNPESNEDLQQLTQSLATAEPGSNGEENSTEMPGEENSTEMPSEENIAENSDSQESDDSGESNNSEENNNEISTDGDPEENTGNGGGFISGRPRPEPFPAKAIYVSGAMAGTQYFESRFELIQSTELNAIVLEVKDEAGKIMFKDKVPVSDELGLNVGNIRDIDAFLSRMKEEGLYTIARMVCFKDNGIIESNPEFALYLDDGSIHYEGKTAWLNPYNRDIWEYLAEVAISIAKLGFDEIQLDYVRFPTDIKNHEFPEEMTGGLSKIEVMNEFAKFMMEKLEPYNVVVAADVFAIIIISDFDAQTLGQDYVELAKIYDVLSPMIYPSHYAGMTFNIENPDMFPYEVVYNTLKVSNEKLSAAEAEGHKVARIRPWLQDFEASWLQYSNLLYQTYTGVQIEEQIRACADNGIYEWMLWDTKNNYNGFRDFVGQQYD